MQHKKFQTKIFIPTLILGCPKVVNISRTDSTYQNVTKNVEPEELFPKNVKAPRKIYFKKVF